MQFFSGTRTVLDIFTSKNFRLFCIIFDLNNNYLKKHFFPPKNLLDFKNVKESGLGTLLTTPINTKHFAAVTSVQIDATQNVLRREEKSKTFFRYICNTNIRR